MHAILKRFENPDEFVVDRPNARQHIAFGHGVHTCPGAPLARAEARVALERVLDRMHDIRISEAHHGPAGARQFTYAPTFVLRGMRQLHLEFTPAENRVTPGDTETTTFAISVSDGGAPVTDHKTTVFAWSIIKCRAPVAVANSLVRDT